jgi:hypothetical protein
MIFHIITLFPESFESYFSTSIIGRAIKDKKIKIKYYNPRDFTKDKNKRIDQKPYGGGPGMVIEALPIIKAIEKAKGKKIHGYAASTKGNTTLQYYGITPDLIDAIADRNPVKWGKYTVASGIPIISEEESRNKRPDYYFVLAWHFLPEFINREKVFLNAGGKFIVPMPEFRIVDGQQAKR